MLRLMLGLFLFVMANANVDNCVGKNRVTSGCGTVVIYAKIRNDLNLTITLDGPIHGMLQINIGGQQFDCGVADDWFFFTDVYKAPVSLYVTKGAVKISDSEKTDKRIVMIQFLDVDQYSYVKLELGFPTGTGQIAFKLENGEFVIDLPAEDSGFDGYAIAGIVVGCLVAFAIVLTVIWAVSVRTCCKKRWANRTRCRRGRNRVLAAKTARPAAATSRSKTPRSRLKKVLPAVTSHSKVPRSRSEKALPDSQPKQPERKKTEPTSEDSATTSPQLPNPEPKASSSLQMPPSPLRNGKRPEEVAVGEYAVKSPPNTTAKFKKHQEHRKGVDTTNGYNPLPHCYFCFKEEGMMAQKKRYAEEKAMQAEEEAKMRNNSFKSKDSYIEDAF